MFYIYKGHLDGLYISEEYLTDTHCGICDDYDRLAAKIHNECEFGEFLRSQLDIFGLGGYTEIYLQELYEEGCELLKDNKDKIKR